MIEIDHLLSFEIFLNIKIILVMIIRSATIYVSGHILSTIGTTNLLHCGFHQSPVSYWPFEHLTCFGIWQKTKTVSRVGHFIRGILPPVIHIRKMMQEIQVRSLCLFLWTIFAKYVKSWFLVLIVLSIEIDSKVLSYPKCIF